MGASTFIAFVFGVIFGVVGSLLAGKLRKRRS